MSNTQRIVGALVFILAVLGAGYAEEDYPQLDYGIGWTEYIRYFPVRRLSGFCTNQAACTIWKRDSTP